MHISADRINISGSTQARAGLNEATVSDYAEAMKEGAEFPPVKVYHDGKHYWLADGFHRFHATKRAGLSGIEADVTEGTQRDAVFYSLGANATHGLKRTNDDKHEAVLTMLDDDEWKAWSDRAIADACKVSATYVGKLRKEMTPSDDDGKRTYTNKNGEKATMDTAKIGKAKAEPKAEPEKVPEVRQVNVTEEIPSAWTDAQVDDEGDESDLEAQLDVAHKRLEAFETASTGVKKAADEIERLVRLLSAAETSRDHFMDKANRLIAENAAKDKEIAKLKAKLADKG